MFLVSSASAAPQRLKVSFGLPLFSILFFDSPLDMGSPISNQKLEISPGKTSAVAHESCMVRIFDEDHGKVTSWASASELACYSFIWKGDTLQQPLYTVDFLYLESSLESEICWSSRMLVVVYV